MYPKEHLPQEMRRRRQRNFLWKKIQYLIIKQTKRTKQL